MAGLFGFKIIRQFERGVVFRWGRALPGLREPGLTWVNPFTDRLRRLQELDWTLRCMEHDGVGLVYAPEPLVVWYADENRQRISADSPWRESLEWLRDSRPRVTRRAYAALAMSVVSSMAAPTRDPRAFAVVLREAVRHGRPGVLDYLTFLQVWLLPTGLRRAVRDAILGRRRTKVAPA